ncbi:conserved hypothetical protein [Talaromyces stipitatus ATCC 10500]|uniref:Chromo domain-containing protein n=1 Tax=Talaromyces stipitatus (strain ATCC 10500 / CBS 375.48 / QM 6759 / NRRL 1006) TaxID=441959 RepID=B8MNT5_TALSN|nr:uncharacterized protein TSTA_103930 [Talaromyces stipitatus ATCC 10500]EED14174.1 conserved hypothetical protein [Talaromyces stipitatus ATCC 10500]
MQIYDVFTLEKLRCVSSTKPLRGQILERAKPVEINKKILDSKMRWNKLHYQVKWLGYDPNPRWYLAANFKNAPRQLKSFHNRYPEKPGPPVNLQRWIEAAERDEFVNDDRKDNAIEELEPSA